MTWYDTRNDTSGNNQYIQPYSTISAAGGGSFVTPNVLVPHVNSSASTLSYGATTAAYNNAGVGLYMGLAFFDNSLWPAWADNSNSTNDNPNGQYNGFNVYIADPGHVKSQHGNASIALNMLAPSGTAPVVPWSVTASIGFWNSEAGQAQINSFIGGPTSTQLTARLAVTLPNIFGAYVGSTALINPDGTYLRNAQVAAQLQQDLHKRAKLDAQLLATTRNLYATSETLDNTGAAVDSSFTVGGDGVGTVGFNVGDNGDVFSMPDNSVLTVLDLLQAAKVENRRGREPS